MNKAAFERALKAVATGKPLKTIKFVDSEGRLYTIVGVAFDHVHDTILIVGESEGSEVPV